MRAREIAQQNYRRRPPGFGFLSPAAFVYFGFRRCGARASLKLAFQNKIWHASGMKTELILTDAFDALELGERVQDAKNTAAGLKYDGGKPPTELIAPEALIASIGAEKLSSTALQEALIWLAEWYSGVYKNHQGLWVGSEGVLAACASWLLRALNEPDAPADDKRTPFGAWLEVAKVLGFGAKKYAEWNWSKGIKYSRVYGAALRHIFAFLNGEVNDSETGLNHLAHALCEVMFLQGYEAHGIGQCIDPADGKPFDDRPFDSVYTAKFAGSKTEPVPALTPKTAASRELADQLLSSVGDDEAPKTEPAPSEDEPSDELEAECCLAGPNPSSKFCAPPRLDRCPDCGPDGCDDSCK